MSEGNTEKFDNLVEKWKKMNEESCTLFEQILKEWDIPLETEFDLRMLLIEDIIARLNFAPKFDLSVHDLFGKVAEQIVVPWRPSDDPNAPWPSALRQMLYKDYLLTNHWKRKRLAALWWAENRCQTCNAPVSLTGHHRSYTRRGEERLSDVTILCDRCHKLHPPTQLHKEGA